MRYNNIFTIWLLNVCHLITSYIDYQLNTIYIKRKKFPQNIWNFCGLINYDFLLFNIKCFQVVKKMINMDISRKCEYKLYFNNKLDNNKHYRLHVLLLWYFLGIFCLYFFCTKNLWKTTTWNYWEMVQKEKECNTLDGIYVHIYSRSTETLAVL